MVCLHQAYQSNFHYSDESLECYLLVSYQISEYIERSLLAVYNCQEDFLSSNNMVRVLQSKQYELVLQDLPDLKQYNCLQMLMMMLVNINQFEQSKRARSFLQLNTLLLFAFLVPFNQVFNPKDMLKPVFNKNKIIFKKELHFRRVLILYLMMAIQKQYQKPFNIKQIMLVA